MTVIGNAIFSCPEPSPSQDSPSQRGSMILGDFQEVPEAPIPGSPAGKGDQCNLVGRGELNQESLVGWKVGESWQGAPGMSR